VTVTLNAADSGGSGVDKIFLDGTLYTGPRTYSSQGATAFNYFAKDKAGNIETVKSGSFKIDSAAPAAAGSLAGVLGGGGWYGSPVEVSVSADDLTSGVATIELDGTPYTGPRTYSGEGAQSVAYSAADAAGNTSPSQTLSFKIDTTAPATSASLSGTPGNGGWYVSPVTVTLSASDAASGVAGATLDGSAYGGPRTYASEGETVVTFASTDTAGNTEPTGTDSFKIDTGAPTTTDSLSGTPGNAGWYVSPVTVALSASDAASGIAATTLDGSAYGGPRTYTSDGATNIGFASTDIAGNTEAASGDTFKIDTVAPTVSAALSGMLGNADWYVSPVSVTLSASDATSGVGQAKLDGELYSTAVTFDVDGAYAPAYSAVDVAGNASTAGTVTFKIDRTPPATGLTVSGRAGQAGWYVSPLSLSLPAADAASGVAATYLNGAPYGGAWTVGGEQDYAYTFSSTDAAGNVEGAHTAKLRLDLRPPAVSLHALFGVITLAASDSRSGVAGGVVGIMDSDWHLIRHWNFGGDSLTVFWDGLDESGRAAPPGSFIWASVGDNAGNEASVGLDAPPTPTATVIATETATSTRTRVPRTPAAHAVAIGVATVTPSATATTTATAPAKTASPPPVSIVLTTATEAVEEQLNWFLLTIAAALLTLAALTAARYVFDPRTPVVRRLKAQGARWLATERADPHSDGG
jgi:hypothetical protein